MTYKFKIGDRVRLTEDVPIVNMDGRCVPRGSTGTVHNAVHSSIGMWSVRLDDSGFVVLFHERQFEHFVDDSAFLRSQLTARDAALDAVLDFATNEQYSMCDSPGETALRRKIVELLTLHGVHPR